ncbi:hypothetical protein GCM10025865_01230 [Paraoerskovia sediminicola]|uniref:Uncharacterized protein n=1 Tax=Paraoerskovia sediminicola TaxID=1138587 RepID=A0ABM8FYK3_9CELL|nr:hypothetical protein [Paraoerskovia sediminicola]BDZ40824.1 hypothetical protein GCM10025865_01230 [Paraoerskovia sediminicola]
MSKHKVTLTLPWKSQDGVNHKQGTTVEVDRATRNDLVFLGRARDAKDTPAPSPVDGKVK